MTRLRFVKPWSTYRPGDYMETASPFTVERMVRTYGLAEVVNEVGVVVPLPPIEPEDKAVEEPVRDKMMRRAKKSKTHRIAQEGPQKTPPSQDTD